MNQGNCTEIRILQTPFPGDPFSAHSDVGDVDAFIGAEDATGEKVQRERRGGGGSDEPVGEKEKMVLMWSSEVLWLYCASEWIEFSATRMERKTF